MRFFFRQTQLLLRAVKSNPGRVLLQQHFAPAPCLPRPACSWILTRAAAERPAVPCGRLMGHREGGGVLQQLGGTALPWSHQQVRTRKRGTEYQPSNIKRKRTHGWIRRISTQGGIEVILRRMLKGRKSLTH
ncbi:39S ribosomal protein L34, mitochondrial-like [Polyodon spathula]|uniref:39S ribosomal protein L34, mitochondrial-like n=1 Tax=Polyodon spathula TaxID=7913 RepID=UPI001B7DDD03|nr:39S ribosomal protein L34, mitochondrial-like [Polyodon spathula]